MGSQMRADAAIAATTQALAVLMLVVVVFRLAAISGMAVMMEVLRKTMGRAIQHTEKRMTQRRHVGSFATRSSWAISGRGGSSSGELAASSTLVMGWD